MSDLLKYTEMPQLTRLAAMWGEDNSHTFDELSSAVSQAHQLAQSGAVKAINQLMTLRNWLIGYYIVEYEQQGSDRAKYGDRLLKRLEESVNTKGLNQTLFRNSRSFYKFYPQMTELFQTGATASHILIEKIHPTPSDELATGPLVIHPTPSDKFTTSPKTIVERLSFSHICEIMTQKDPLARFFYETECIKGTWSVKELRRQIATNLYYRSGVSKDPKKLLASLTPERDTAALAIRQPFAFEFLGLDAKDVVTESDLENALVTNLQEFILELGKGFCFESRQKRMIIDDEYCFADLVFYNRILHCNVIVELKNDEFRHEYLGQLNAYVSYYKENEMSEGDNPPVGILLCTRKGKKMVEYALAGMDNHLFVSTYMLTLPSTDMLEEFLLKETREM